MSQTSHGDSMPWRIQALLRLKKQVTRPTSNHNWFIPRYELLYVFFNRKEFKTLETRKPFCTMIKKQNNEITRRHIYRNVDRSTLTAIEKN